MFSVEQYTTGCTKLADIDNILLGDLAELEQHLTNEQDLTTVRGKVLVVFLEIVNLS